MFPKIGVPQNGWFIMGNPIKMDELGVPLFLETPISAPGPFIFPGESRTFSSDGIPVAFAASRCPNPEVVTKKAADFPG